VGGVSPDGVVVLGVISTKECMVFDAYCCYLERYNILNGWRGAKK
jgi:hypothetical protein